MASTCIRVGIADDDELIRLILIRALGKTADMRVVAAVENGAEAVHLATSGQIDVLLLDVEMPRMTGTEALAVIKLVAPGVQVVMHSSRCSPENYTRLLDAGAAACLAKPCSVSHILETIRAVAGAHVDSVGC